MGEVSQGEAKAEGRRASPMARREVGKSIAEKEGEEGRRSWKVRGEGRGFEECEKERKKRRRREMNVEGTKKTRRLTLFSSLFPSAVDWFLPRGRIKAKQTEARIKPATPKTSPVKRVVKVGLLQRGGGRSDVNSESGSAHLLFPSPAPPEVWTKSQTTLVHPLDGLVNLRL